MPVVQRNLPPIKLSPAQSRYASAQNTTKYTTKRTIKKKRKKL